MTATDLIAGLSAPIRMTSAPFGADVFALVEALKVRGGVALLVTRDDKTAMAAIRVAQFVDPTLNLIDFPSWDTLPYDRISPAAAITSQRCAAMAELASWTPKDGNTLVVTTANAIVQRVPSVELMRASSFRAYEGDVLSTDHITHYLSTNGYVRTGTVRETGEYSVRGGLIDIFAPTETDPIRIDLFGDEVESVRRFDAETQRSKEAIEGISFAPVSEILFNEEVLSSFRERYLNQFGPPAGDSVYEAARASIRKPGVESWLPLFHDRLDTLFDYLPDGSLIGLSPLANEASAERITQVSDYFEARIEAAEGDVARARVLSPEDLYLTSDEFENLLDTKPGVRFSTSADEGDMGLGAQPARDFAPERTQSDVNIFNAVAKHVKDLRSHGKAVVLASWTEGSASRLQNVLADHGLENLPNAYSAEAAVKAGISVTPLPLLEGFTIGDLAIIAEPDILGDRLAAPRRKRKAANFITEAAALSSGDLIVHVDHGVGRYVGLKTLELTGAPHDCLQLEYYGGDKIFLPVENIDLISRYGSEDSTSQVDRLGGVGWQTRKARAKKRILELAAELMQIAAARELKKAEPINSEQGFYDEFCAGFPYEETEDQLRAIEDVLGDLVSGRPMDRLICGDVGFGKTEVALRAAFVSAMNGQQVAVIAPTTLLARQHFKTFSERLSGWPLKVRHLSRLVSGKEASATREGLKTGQVDVVIGTHALLAQSIDFKRLGVLIVDEEQRFGVKHKERLKELKADVHVLTLSATPIPRTLQMALTGIRDLSIIATPPVDRLSVRTYVTEEDTVTLREALLREKYRGGQGFFVAPRIKDLDKIETFLKDNIPEVSFVVAHGQMPPGELEDIMNAFYEGEYDVLLSTTIVESGLDIPRANTLIIHRADMFGLAQLYQLRGRVGRSKLRAYAYFTTPRDRQITETAQKRLKVLQNLDSLGAGFQLASYDLDLRGAGNLLGDQQSGQVREVGVELYQSMLEDAVKALQAGDATDTDFVEDWSPQINLGVGVRIPETYVEDLSTRLSLYKRLANIDNAQDREAFAVELIDRFGHLPKETEHLFEIATVKALCKQLGIKKLDAGDKGAVFAFREDTQLQPEKLLLIVRSRPSQLKLKPDSKLVHKGISVGPDLRSKKVMGFLNELAEGLETEAA